MAAGCLVSVAFWAAIAAVFAPPLGAALFLALAFLLGLRWMTNDRPLY